MTLHTVEIANAHGQSMKILIRLDDRGGGTWQTLDKGYFCYEGGVADTGNTPPTNPLAWVALYGGNAVDDDKLVLHLDDFCGHTGASHAGGEGVVYAQDDLLMGQGRVRWQLVG